MAYQKIHILGASGSGVTTLGRALAAKLGCPSFDCDDYFWLPTPLPYQVKRERAQRQTLLLRELSAHDSWVLSGSACGWGDIFIPLLDAVVYLRLPTALRIERIRGRERERFGDQILPGGAMHQSYLQLLDYAALYDTGDESVRSSRLHEKWLSGLACKVVRIEEDVSVAEKVRRVLAMDERDS